MGTGPEQDIYALRFNDEETRVREVTWKVLCQEVFQSFVKESDVVLDLGAGDGFFLRGIKAARRIAVDVNPEAKNLEKLGIEVYVGSLLECAENIRGQANVVMLSNVLEHLPTKYAVIELLEDLREVLAEGGRVIILQPNIRYTGASYWDYIDHHIALTEQSVAEALRIAGYEIEKVVPRFLPYTAKSRMGLVASWLGPERMTRFYLKCPFLWRFFGAQTLLIAKKQ